MAQQHASTSHLVNDVGIWITRLAGALCKYQRRNFPFEPVLVNAEEVRVLRMVDTSCSRASEMRIRRYEDCAGVGIAPEL